MKDHFQFRVATLSDKEKVLEHIISSFVSGEAILSRFCDEGDKKIREDLDWILDVILPDGFSVIAEDEDSKEIVGALLVYTQPKFCERLPFSQLKSSGFRTAFSITEMSTGSSSFWDLIEESYLHVFALSVKEDLRGRGLGKEIVEKGLLSLKEKSVKGKVGSLYTSPYSSKIGVGLGCRVLQGSEVYFNSLINKKNGKEVFEKWTFDEGRHAVFMIMDLEEVID